MAILKAKRFILRPLRKGDEFSLQRNINDKAIYSYTAAIPYPYSLKTARKWIQENLRRERQKKRSDLHFAIVINDEAGGSIGLNKIEGHKTEIGYWLGRNYWGKGIMSEAVAMLTKFAFNKLKLRRLSASVFEHNSASAKVLEKNGYKQEGFLRKYHLKDGKFHNAKLYAKVR